jgi:hypothetical protein
MDSEVVDLTDVMTWGHFRVRMVRIRAAGFGPNRSFTQAARLALNASEASTVVDYEVVSRVLSEWDEDRVSRPLEREHDSESRAVTDCFGVLHTTHRACPIGWAMSASDNRELPYDSCVWPE